MKVMVLKAPHVGCLSRSKLGMYAIVSKPSVLIFSIITVQDTHTAQAEQMHNAGSNTQKYVDCIFSEQDGHGMTNAVQLHNCAQPGLVVLQSRHTRHHSLATISQLPAVGATQPGSTSCVLLTIIVLTMWYGADLTDQLSLNTPEIHRSRLLSRLREQVEWRAGNLSSI